MIPQTDILNIGDAWVNTRQDAGHYLNPGVEIPVSTFVTSENRQLEGLDPQTNLQVESKLTYRFRKIKLTASYMMVHEKLTTEDYNYTELRANISRNFDIY